MRNRAINQKGMTLVEVLVAVFILVFGLYALFRVFPMGLNLVQSGQNRNVATRLADRLLQQLEAAPERAPLGIQNTTANMPVVDEDGNALGPTVNGWEIQPDWLKLADIDPDGFGPNMTEVREVVGEGLRIPSPVLGTTVSVAHNLFGPAEVGAAVECWAPYTRVNNAFYDLRDDEHDYQHFYVTTAEQGDGSVNWQRAGYARFDRVPYDRNMELNCIYYDSAAAAYVPYTGTFTLAANDDDTMLPVAGLPDFEFIVDSSIRISRQFTEVGGNPAANSEFSLDDDGGVLRFYGEDQGQFVRYSYSVRDWHILSEFDVLDVYGEMRTDITFLDDGDLPGMATTVLGVTLDDGLLHTPDSVDYENGVVLFSDTLANRPIRVFYRGMEEWAVLAQRAQAQYFNTTAAAPLGNEYIFAAIAPDASLEFSGSEAGKVVLVSFMWDDDNNASTASIVETRQLTISPGPAPYTATIVNAGGGPIGAGDLLSVTGLSLGVKAIWHDRDMTRYIQLDTLLEPEAL